MTSQSTESVCRIKKMPKGNTVQSQGQQELGYLGDLVNTFHNTKMQRKSSHRESLMARGKCITTFYRSILLVSQ